MAFFFFFYIETVLARYLGNYLSKALIFNTLIENDVLITWLTFGQILYTFYIRFQWSNDPILSAIHVRKLYTPCIFTYM